MYNNYILIKVLLTCETNLMSFINSSDVEFVINFLFDFGGFCKSVLSESAHSRSFATQKSSHKRKEAVTPLHFPNWQRRFTALIQPCFSLHQLSAPSTRLFQAKAYHQPSHSIVRFFFYFVCTLVNLLMIVIN